MKKLQFVLTLIILVVFLILIYFSLYQVEGFAITEINNSLESNGVVVEGSKRILYLSLFYLLTLCLTTLFILKGMNNKILFLICGVGIVLYGYKVFTSNLILCKWGYCSFYGYVDLLINLFFSLTIAYILSLLTLLGYYFYKKLKYKKKS